MMETLVNLEGKVALVTGAGRRIGAVIAEVLHSAGMSVLLHCHQSLDDAQQLAKVLNKVRLNSAYVIQANLLQLSQVKSLASQSVDHWGRLDTLVNNASVFYPTRLDDLEESQWDDIIGSNLKSALFLSKYLSSELRKRQGCIVNIGDIHAERPLKGYPLYSIAKAGVHMLTKALARELAPEVRCNAVALGALLWPKSECDEQKHKKIINRTALKKKGTPQDAATTVLFLVRDAAYITGQIIAVDGGRILSN